LNNELRRETDKVREEWWKCNVLDELDRTWYCRSDLVYNEVKQLTGQSRICNKNHGVSNEAGELVMKPEEVRKVWKLYIKTFYDKDQKPTSEKMKFETEEEIDLDTVVPELLDSEIFKDVTFLKNRKVEGVDGVSAGLLM